MNHSTVCTRFRAATRAPNDNSMLLVARELFRISKNSTAIETGMFNVFDFQLILFFFLAFGEEDACRLRSFARTRYDNLFAGGTFDRSLFGTRFRLRSSGRARFWSRCSCTGFRRCCSVDNRSGAKPELELLGHIDAIEEIDEGSSQYARLSLRLTLQKPDADAPLWEKRFDERESVGSREPRLVAEAISKLLGKYMEEAIGAIAQAGK